MNDLELNVQGTSEQVSALLARFKDSITARERWSAGDFNITMRDTKAVDAVSDYCEDTGIECKLV